MKITAILVTLSVLGCLVPAQVLSQASGCIQPSSLDMRKAERSESHKLFEHACWPNARTIKVKRYTGSVEVEIADMRKMLGRAIRHDCQPTEPDLKRKIVPLTDLHDGSDYLLLDYRTKSGYRIQIQDSHVFSVLVTAPPRDEKKLSEVQSFVQHTAAAILASPANYVLEPIIRVSYLDIGESRFGSLQYGPRESIVPEDWYTQISWWSDGRQVLFAISTTEKAEYDIQRTRSRLPSGPPPPKVFASRKDADK